MLCSQWLSYCCRLALPTMTTRFGGIFVSFPWHVYLGGVQVISKKGAVCLFYALSTNRYSPPGKHSPAEPEFLNPVFLSLVPSTPGSRHTIGRGKVADDLS